jgi:membrane-associated protease RseP (regulator of RpoE activity)
MSTNCYRGVVSSALMVALVFGAGATAQAQPNDAQDDDGRVVQIGRADGEQPRVEAENEDNELHQPGFSESLQPELPKYWIGLRGGVVGDDDALRAHLDLPANQGLLIVDVVPDSPAAKAGLKKHDILLRANDVELRDMNDLIELVATEGEKKGQITLDIVRHAERETVYITPEERPADAYASQGGGMGGGFGGEFPQGFPRELFGQLERGGQMPFNFRNFGPGVIVGGHGFANMPNGVSVSVHKEAGKPTKVTVKRGDQSWEVSGDDPESLKQLPEDLRPFVERMLQGGSPLGMNIQVPNIEVPEVPAFDDRRLNERLEQMERQMNELLERFGQDGRNTDSDAEQEEAK